MRMLGTIEGQGRAEQFVAHLTTLEIATQVEKSNDDTDRWDIWIRDEDELTPAKAELVLFLANPEDPRYQQALKKAQVMLEAKQQKQEAAVKNIYRGIPTQRGMPPITLALSIICILMTFLASFGKPASNDTLGKTILQQTGFVEERDFRESSEDPFASLKLGEYWRLVSPIFVHGDIIHLGMNLIMLVQLGRLLEPREGSTRFGLIVLVIAILSNLLQGGMPEKYWGYPFFYGISGVVYGLFGYQWIKSTLRPDLIPPPPSMLVIFMLIWLGAGFTGALESIRVANLAHLGGMLSGMGLGWVGQSWGLRARAKRAP